MAPSSAQFRGTVARLLSPLRRVHPRVPFYDLAAHRIPTLWSLYRSLLREAPTDDIAFRVRKLFEKNRHLTGAKKTRDALLLGYKALDTFKKANQGDKHLQAVLLRFSSLISTKRRMAYWNDLARKEAAWRVRLSNRPIMTGGYFRPCASHGPLPRLKPQPMHITGLIVKRRAARTKRIQRLYTLKATYEDLRVEREFEDGLRMLTAQHIPQVFSGAAYDEWRQPLQHIDRQIAEAFARENERISRPYPPKLLAAIKQARREKVENKTRERRREATGEVLKCTIRRRQQGPPAHVLSRMSPKRRHLDKVSRQVGEVGYVGLVKRRLGFRLKNRDAWKVEEGKPENVGMLDALAKNVRRENERRMKKLNKDLSSQLA